MKVEIVDSDGNTVDPPEVVSIVQPDIDYIAEVYAQRGNEKVAKAVKSLKQGAYKEGDEGFDAALLVQFARTTYRRARIVEG